MSEKAFPAPYWNDDRMMYLNQGMTLRDYFAAKAMQGICANEQTAGDTYDDVAERAWRQADAMLKAREQ